MKLSVIGLGAGGHAAVIIEALRLGERYEVLGLLDPNPRLKGAEVLGAPVLGADDALPELAGKGIQFFVGVGSAGDSRIRERLFELGLNNGLEPIGVIHPKAIVSPSARIGRGVAILAGAVVNARAELGDNVIINTGSIVEHDCVVGAHAHIASGAMLAGSVTVGRGAHVGIGATVRQCIAIGARAVVGAGAVVIEDVRDGVTVGGVPARPLRDSHERKA